MNDPVDAIHSALNVLNQTKEKTSFEPSLEEVGEVIQVEKGIAFVKGLPRLEMGELIQFGEEIFGFSFDLQKDHIGAILFDRSEELEVGMEARRTFRVLEVPVGDALIGRMIDPLVRPIDRENTLHLKEKAPLEKKAPSLMDRLPVVDPLSTGIQTIDAMIPIGRGQRELILGDRQIGKTAIAIDTILNQKNQNVICIYCSIGKEAGEVQRVMKDLKDHGALSYSIVIAARGKDPPGLNFIAPYTAMAIAEYFMQKGRDTLVVLDDLTRHAWSYREISLLLRRPPAREAYPGDIFFIHSRLLERATKLKKELGGGSITALVIIETEEQNISAYIPTNLISITDGQIYFSPQLFQEGIMPAIDIGKSVSRVGGKTQIPIYKNLIQDLRLFFSQYEEIEAFSRFGTRLDEETKQKIKRGSRIREVLKQERLKPLPVADQIAFLSCLIEGFFDLVPIDRIPKLKEKIQKKLYEDFPGQAKKMNEMGELSKEELKNIKNSLKDLFEKTEDKK